MKPYYLKTSRLELVPMTGEFLQTTHAYAADHLITKMMTFLPSDSLEDTQKFIDESEAQWHSENQTDFQYAILFKKHHIGGISFTILDGQNAELGWIIQKSFQGNGYAAEAAQALIEWGSKNLKIKKFIAHCDSENIASYKTMENLGMKRVSVSGGRFNKANPDEERREYMYEMEVSKAPKGSLPMHKLCLPLVLEQFFRILVGSADTVMLSAYSGAAVAGVGLMTQYVFFLMLLFSVITTGTTIVLAQYIGAKKSQEELNHVANASTVMIMTLGVLLTFLVILGTKPLLSCYTLEDEVRRAAFDYFVIFGGIGAIFNAASLLQSAILRAYGYTKQALYVTFAANVINVAGNALSLYGFFGFPILGVKGVAGASLVSMIVSCILLQIIIKKKKDVAFNLKTVRSTPRSFYRLILSIGVPTASESLSYNISQIVIMAMISTLGTYAMSAQVYTRTICQYVYIVAIGMGAACQIKAGYFVGAQQSQIAYKKMFGYSLVATAVSVSMISLVNIFDQPIISIFTKNPEVFKLVNTLLRFSILVEFGRSLNLIWIGGLKGAGDIRFPVLYGMFSNWCIMVFLSWLLGLKLGWGVAGCWLGIGLDETTRGIVMVFRWISKRWMSKALVRS